MLQNAHHLRGHAGDGAAVRRDSTAARRAGCASPQSPTPSCSICGSESERPPSAADRADGRPPGPALALFRSSLPLSGLAESLRQRIQHQLAVLRQRSVVGAFGADRDLVRAVFKSLHAGRTRQHLRQRQNGPRSMRRSALELDGHQHAALEFNAIARPALDREADETGHGQNQRSDDKRPLLPEKIKIGVFK